LFGSFLPSLLVGLRTTNSTRVWEPTLSWNQLHQLRLSVTHDDCLLGSWHFKNRIVNGNICPYFSKISDVRSTGPEVNKLSAPGHFHAGGLNVFGIENFNRTLPPNRVSPNQKPCFLIKIKACGPRA